MKINRLMSRSIRDAEVLDETSQTIPDMALTVRDIISRFTRGQISVPSIETGDPDDIDSPYDFDDEIEAFDSVRNGSVILNDLKNGQKDKDSSKQDSSVDCSSPESSD